MIDNKTKRFKWQKIGIITLVVMMLFSVAVFADAEDGTGTWRFHSSPDVQAWFDEIPVDMTFYCYAISEERLFLSVDSDYDEPSYFLYNTYKQAEGNQDGEMVCEVVDGSIQWYDDAYRTIVVTEPLSEHAFLFLSTVAEYIAPLEPTPNNDGFLSSVLGVFLTVGSWLATAVGAFIPMFYANGSLTFLGVLAVAGLALSVSLLLIALLRNWLAFR